MFQADAQTDRRHSILIKSLQPGLSGPNKLESTSEDIYEYESRSGNLVYSTGTSSYLGTSTYIISKVDTTGYSLFFF